MDVKISPSETPRKARLFQHCPWETASFCRIAKRCDWIIIKLLRLSTLARNAPLPKLVAGRFLFAGMNGQTRAETAGGLFLRIGLVLFYGNWQAKRETTSSALIRRGFGHGFSHR